MSILSRTVVGKLMSCFKWMSRAVVLCVISLAALSSQADKLPADEWIRRSAVVADAIERGPRTELLQQVESLLASGADVNAAQVDGMSGLHWAALIEDAEIVQMLVQAGANVQAENRYGVTPLAIACESGKSEVVRVLLDAGADANAQVRGGVTMLMLAARTGRTAPVAMLLDHGAEVAAEDRRQQTAIMWAAAEGHAGVVQLLIEAGADFDQRLESGFSPLMFAVREGRREVVLALLAAGADVNYQMNPKKTGGRHPRRAMSPLHLAIENGHFELAAELLTLGADANDQRCGFTPLHNLTWVRKPPRGDNVEGAPPPIGSGKMTSLQFARVLVEHGAEVNARLKKGAGGRGKMNDRGATAFMFAARRDDVPFMKLLLELGADPSIPNAENCTPLLVAAGIGTQAPGEEAGTEEEAIEAVELLLSLGADINHVDDNGETAMHGAAYKNLPEVIRLLDARGADINVWNQRNKLGWTPTLIAEGHRPGNFRPAAATLTAVYEALERHGISPPPKTPRERRIGYDQ